MIDYTQRRRHPFFKDPKPNLVEIPPDAVQIASLSSITTIIMTIIYMVLYIIYLVYRFKPNSSIGDLNGSEFFVYIMSEVYVKEDHNINGLPSNLTKSFTIYRLVVIALTLSVLSLLGAGGLLWTTYIKKKSPYFVNMAYMTIIPYVLCLGVDIAFAFFLGLDYSNLSFVMDRNDAGALQNYTTDTVRLVSLFLATIAMKGYIVHLIQAAFLIILVLKAFSMDLEMGSEHSFNRMSILKAFETAPDQKAKQEAQRHIQEMELAKMRGLKKTRHDEKQTANDFGGFRHGTIDDALSNYSSRSFEPMPVGKQPIPVDVQWHRDDIPSTSRTRTPAITPVPIPAPDYSPEPARRLKPALKSGYQI